MALSRIRSESVDLTDDFAFTGAVSGAGSNIKERLVMLCDGEDYTVSSGTYTSTNVTAKQDLTTTSTDISTQPYHIHHQAVLFVSFMSLYFHMFS